jgi:hypothetical protein
MLPGINEISRDDVSGTRIGSIAGVVKPSDERRLVSRQHWCRIDTRPIRCVFVNSMLVFS